MKIFYYVLVLCSFGAFDIMMGQDHHHEQHSREEILRAERVVSFFSKRLQALVIDTCRNRESKPSFLEYATDQIARDNRLVLGKVIHGELDSSIVDSYIENQLLRVYRGLYQDYQLESFVAPAPVIKVEAAGDPCNNVDFESGTTAGWEGYYGRASTVLYPSNFSLSSGFLSNNHAIMTGSGYDPIVGSSLLPVVAPGGNYSLRLENTSIGGDLARIRQTFLVNPANANFIYRYAVVLEDPSNSHSDSERPYFKIKVFDQSGNEIECGRYEVIAKPPITGFQQVQNTDYYWRNWTSVSIPLMNYVGQNVTVEFTASDCSLTGHLGYAYIDGSCFQSSIISIPSGSCGGLPYTLIAPPGFASYAWTGPAIVGNTNTQTVVVNQAGTYNCVITSVSGPTCRATLKAVVGNAATLDAGPNFSICNGSYAQLNGSVSLATSFTWSPTTGLSNPNVLNPVARPTVTTKYYLTACGITDSATVFVDNFDVAVTPNTTICGSSLVNLSATPSTPGDYTYSWSPSAGMSNPNSASPSVSPLSTTTYTVVVTNTNSGCSVTKQVTISVTSGTTNAGANRLICQGSSTPLSASGGSSFTWTLLDGSTPADLSCTSCAAPVATPSVTTSYVVTSNLSGACKNRDTVLVTVLGRPQVYLGNDTTICEGNSLALVAPAYPIISWSTGSIANTIQVSAAGMYILTVSDGLCSNRDTIEVFVTPKPVAALGDDTILCAGSTLLLDGGNSDLTALWSDGSSQPTLTVSAGGIYWVQFSRGNCPAVRDSIEVSYRSNPVLELGNDTSLCQGNVLLLDATNTLSSYQWSTGATAPSITVSQAGKYYVQVTNGACDPVSDTIQVAVIQNPHVDLGNDTVLCAGSTLLLDGGNSDLTALWSDGSSQPTLTVSAGGIYWVQFSRGNCPAVRDSIEVSYRSNPVLDLGNDTSLCEGNALLLDATNTLSSYQWSTGATAPSITVSQAGKYYVQVTNGACDPVSDTVQVAVIQNPHVDLGNDTVLCAGSTLLLDGGNSDLTALWSDGSSQPTLTVSAGGIYWVQFSRGNCPAVRDSIEVSYRSNPVLELGNDTSLCQGSSVLLDASNSSSSYVWSTGATSPTIIVSQTGKYFVLVNNGVCDPVSDTIHVTVFAKPIVDLGKDTVLCAGETLLLHAGNPGLTYAWSDASTQGDLSVSGNGIYWVDVSNNVCPVVRDSISVVFNAFPVLDLGLDRSSCITTLMSLSAGALSHPVLWSTGETSLTITPQVSGTYWARSSNGRCESSDTVEVTYVPIARAQFGEDTTACVGTTILLDAYNDGSTYEWSTGSTNSSILVHNEGEYWVDIDNGNCAIARFTVEVLFIEPPVVHFSIDSAVVCYSDSMLLETPVEGLTYKWYDQNEVIISDSSRALFYNGTTGHYWISVGNGYCYREDSVFVQYSTPTYQLSDTSICMQDSLVLHLPDIYRSYLWSTGSTESSISFVVLDEVRDSLNVRIVDQYGCAYSDSMVIVPVDCRIIELYIPNLITPNGDERNDQFYILGLPAGSSLSIHNRWGDEVYVSSNYQNDWSGVNTSDGMYYYHLVLKDKREFKGWLQILK